MQGEVPFRENFGLMPEGTEVIMYLVLIPFAAVFFYGIFTRFRSYGIGNLLGELLKDPRSSLIAGIKYAWGQRRVILDRSAGLMHVPLMYGTFILFIGTTLVFIDNDILEIFNEKLLKGPFYVGYEVALDLFGLLFMWGLVLALHRRVKKLERLRGKREYYAAIVALLFIGSTGYLLEALRLYLRPVMWGGYSFVGWTVARLLERVQLEASLASHIYQTTWWAHALVTFGLIAAVPYTNLLHVFTSSLHVIVAHKRPEMQSSITTPFRLSELTSEMLEQLKVGIRSVEDLDWRRRLSLDACTDCGRCDSVCPALSSGTPLSPRMVVQKLRMEVWRSNEGGPSRDFFNSGVLTNEEVWACTTCAACVEACPVLISPLEFIIEGRRALAMEGKLDRKMVNVLNNLSRYQNPYGLSVAAREALLEELKKMGVKTVEEKPDFEYVYWFGCMATYDERSKGVALKVVDLLMKANVNLAVLPEEVCTGDPARRMGEEGRYQELALTNIEILKRYGVKKIITHCPHCFNILKNEYKDLGLELEVFHHTQILSRLNLEGEVTPKVVAKVTLHDSCYLSRVNGIIEEPRNAMKGLEIVEMRRTGRRSFCCGAGGGNYWYEVRRSKRESHQRLEEAIETGAEVLVVECPFCLAMFEDAVRSMGLEERIKVKEISELF